MILRRTPSPRPCVGDHVSHKVHPPGRISVVQNYPNREPWAFVTEDWPWLSYVVPLRELVKVNPPQRAMLRRAVRR